MKHVLIGFSIAAAVAVGAQAATPTAQDILTASDRLRNSDKPVKLTDVLTEYIGGVAKDKVVLRIHSKMKPSGEYASLVLYVDPPRDRGKMVLMDGTQMWFYDSSSKASVRVSPQQRLLGQASNGDVVSVNFAYDYAASLVGAETVKDADRQARDCHHLDLKPKTDSAVYSRIEYWVEKDTHQPVKGKFYSDSGRLLKIAYYHKYRVLMGKLRPSETIIIDAVDKNLVTTMTYESMEEAVIPDAWFQREYLPRLKAE